MFKHFKLAKTEDLLLGILLIYMVLMSVTTAVVAVVCFWGD